MAIAACLSSPAVGVLFAEETWPQFRGPSGDGHSSARGLPLAWSETQHVAWKTALPGQGWSSPVVAAGRAWMTAATADGLSLRALAVDVATGKLLHDVEVFHRDTAISKNAKNGFASPTPVLDERFVYVHFGTQGTACLDQTTAAVVWKNEELTLDHKEGPGSSPILWHDLVMLTCDGMDVQYVAALDKRTGRVRWKTARSGKMHDNPDFRKAYCTPLITTIDGRDQLVSPGADRVIGYDPATGNELWKVEYHGFSIVPRPAMAHGLLFVTTAFARPELWAIRTGAAGDATETHVAWKMKKLVPSSPSPLVVGDELYLISDKGILTCVAARTGEELWSERIGGNFSASPLYADGRIYLFGEDGTGYVVQPGKAYTLLAENHLEGRILASPAVVDSALLVRTDGALYRLENSAQQTGK
jgi:outer membrane protein assembly factor BamB